MDRLLRQPSLIRAVIHYLYDTISAPLDRSNLLSLIQVSKAFQRHVESVLYCYIFIRSPIQIYLFCRSITSSSQPRIGAIVERLHIGVGGQTTATIHTDDGSVLDHRGFHSYVARMLRLLPNLEKLWLHEAYRFPSWVFSSQSDLPGSLPAQLTSLDIPSMKWDHHTAPWVRSLPKLRHLQFLHSGENSSALTSSTTADKDKPLAPTGFISLETCECSLNVATEIVISSSAPLKYLQIPFNAKEDDDHTLLHILNALPRHRKTLRSLSIDRFPLSVQERVLPILVSHCLELRHLGVIDLPVVEKKSLYKHLLGLHQLVSLEIHFSSDGGWSSGFVPGDSQDLIMLCSELRLYRHTLRYIVFNIERTYSTWRSLWFFVEDEEIWRQQSDVEFPFWRSF